MAQNTAITKALKALNDSPIFCLYVAISEAIRGTLAKAILWQHILTVARKKQIFVWFVWFCLSV